MRTMMASTFLAAVMSLWQAGQATALPDTPEPDDFFGQSTATGDFNADGFADLAVGVPSEEVGASTEAGAVHVLYGSSAGLSATGNQLWHLDSPGIAGDAEPGSLYGWSLAAANFGSGSQADVAIGMPWHNLNVLAQIDSGAIGVVYGSSTGLSATGSQVWQQDSPDIEDDAEGSDFFGLSLAGGNFGKGSQSDLAVGIPNEDLGANTDAGAVNVIYGTSNGLMATDDQFWRQGP